MKKISNAAVNAAIRSEIFSDLFRYAETEGYAYDYQKINDRQYGAIVTDKNGERRYVRVGIIVADVREDMTADELMAMEMNDYATKQAEKIAKAQARAEKARKDKERREQEKKEKEKEKEGE